jgi:predicted small integral membrane protein
VLRLRRGSPAARDLLVLGVVGTGYAVFALIGMGSEPFLWALALAAVGVPLYLVMRRANSKPAAP